VASLLAHWRLMPQLLLLLLLLLRLLGLGVLLNPSALYHLLLCCTASPEFL
jgi:hypothetical protein